MDHPVPIARWNRPATWLRLLAGVVILGLAIPAAKAGYAQDLPCIREASTYAIASSQGSLAALRKCLGSSSQVQAEAPSSASSEFVDPYSLLGVVPPLGNPWWLPGNERLLDELFSQHYLVRTDQNSILVVPPVAATTTTPLVKAYEFSLPDQGALVTTFLDDAALAKLQTGLQSEGQSR